MYVHTTKKKKRNGLEGDPQLRIVVKRKCGIGWWQLFYWPSSERSGAYDQMNLVRKQMKNQQTGNPILHRVNDGEIRT